MELLQALLEWAAAARMDPGPGVPSVHVYEDVESHSTFAMHGEWQSLAALDAHVRSDPFGVLLGALQLLAQSVHLSVGGETVEYGSDPLPVIRRLRETDGAEVDRRRSGPNEAQAGTKQEQSQSNNSPTILNNH